MNFQIETEETKEGIIATLQNIQNIKHFMKKSSYKWRSMGIYMLIRYQEMQAIESILSGPVIVRMYEKVVGSQASS
jgi:hypothetical protein